MEKIVDVKVGQSFTPEEWLDAKDRITSVFSSLLNTVFAEKDEARDAFFMDSSMAISAMEYIAYNASEACRYIILPENDASNLG